jgi:hypothetical protein
MGMVMWPHSLTDGAPCSPNFHLNDIHSITSLLRLGRRVNLRAKYESMRHFGSVEWMLLLVNDRHPGIDLPSKNFTRA